LRLLNCEAGSVQVQHESAQPIFETEVAVPGSDDIPFLLLRAVRQRLQYRVAGGGRASPNRSQWNPRQDSHSRCENRIACRTSEEDDIPHTKKAGPEFEEVGPSVVLGKTYLEPNASTQLYDPHVRVETRGTINGPGRPVGNVGATLPASTRR